MYYKKWLGLTDYSLAFNEQQGFYAQVKSHPQEIYVLGVEHPTVITLGVRGKEDADVLRESQSIQQNDQIKIVKTDRGGQATLHSPGQLVIYPILDLRAHHLSVKKFIEMLFICTQKVLQSYGVDSRIQLDCETGLYTENGKITFCGIRIKEGVSYHGISININNDLSLFKVIRPCGVTAAKIDLLANYLIEASHENFTVDFFEKWSKEFNYLLTTEHAPAK